MRAAALITGGKDSLYALVKALKMGYSVEWLVSMAPRRRDSWMFHWVNVHLTPLVSEAVGIPLVYRETSGVAEREVEDLKRALSKLDVEALVSGAVASRYQKSRVDRVCSELGIRHVTPLWGRDQAELLREMLGSGMEIVFTAVAALGLGPEWLGRRLDQGALEELLDLSRRFGINPCGEGGEYETLVLDAPIYGKRIRIVRSRVVWSGDSGYLAVEKACLEGKA